jgi:protein-tyrosine phosphatase
VIDTHCHLLHGLDDGPRTLDESLALADALWHQGVDTVVCTPHLSRQFPTEAADAERAAEELRDALEQRGLPLELHVAAEIADAVAVTEPFGRLRRRSVGGHVVVEILPATPAVFFLTVVDHLAGAGLTPILAHPERCRAVQRDVRVLDDARAVGALVQVVAPSMVGRWGADVEATAWALLATRRVDLVASDAHGTERRRSYLDVAARLVADRLGPTIAVELTERRPRAVLAAGAPAEEATWS